MRRTLLLILLCGVIRFPAMAQESTSEPESTPEFAFFPEEFLSFPQSLFLRLGLELPGSQVANLTLVIQPEGRSPITIEFPEDVPFEFAGEYTVARYTWAITAETAPPLFGSIRYIWRLTTTGGETETLTRSVDYVDNRVSWINETGDDYLLTLPARVEGVDTTLSQSRLDEVSALLKRNTGQNVTLKWLIFPPDLAPGCRLNDDGEPVVQAMAEDLTRTDVPCDAALANRVYEQSGYTVVRLQEGEVLQTLLLREIVARYYAPLWAESDAPAWFRSGIEQLYFAPGSPALVISRQALRSGTPLSAADLADATADDSAGIRAAQSYGMVRYLMDKIGVEPVYALARAVAETPFAEAYQAAAGNSLATLILDWQTWVFTERAGGAHSYTIFMRTTPTPTLTFTPTITRTPLPPTETPTITPDYSPTPSPTRTRIPPTPTITPLPPQSFDIRPTVLPSPTPLPLLDQAVTGLPVSKGQFAVIGGVVVLLLILIFGVVLWRRHWN